MPCLHWSPHLVESSKISLFEGHSLRPVPTLPPSLASKILRLAILPAQSPNTRVLDLSHQDSPNSLANVLRTSRGFILYVHGSTQVPQNMCIYVDQRPTLRCQFSSLPGGSQEWNSGHQVCWRGPLPAGPHYPPCLGPLWAGLSYFVSSIRCFFFLSPGGARDRTQRLAHARQGLLQSSSYSPGYVLWVSHTESWRFRLWESTAVPHIGMQAFHSSQVQLFPMLPFILPCYEFSIRSAMILHTNSCRFYFVSLEAVIILVCLCFLK